MAMPYTRLPHRQFAWSASARSRSKGRTIVQAVAAIGVAMALAAVFHLPYDVPAQILTLVALAVAVGLVIPVADFILHLIFAPYLQNKEELKAYRQDAADAERRLELDVEISGCNRSQTGMADCYGAVPGDPWLILLWGVRITNRSRTSQVSLSFVLKLALSDDSRLGTLSLREGDHEDYIPTDPSMLRGPLSVAPEDSKAGMIGFLVTLDTEQSVGGPTAIDYLRPELVVTDHVSGKSVHVCVDCDPLLET